MSALCDPAYKDTGVPWLGQIPFHWSAISLRYLAQVQGGGTPSTEQIVDGDTGDFLWATPTDMDGWHSTISERLRSITEKGREEARLYVATSGDILFSCRAPVGKVALISSTMTFNQGCKALIVSADVQAAYLAYQLDTSRIALQLYANGTTFAEISAGTMRSVKLLRPPREEQQAIAAFLDRETAKIDALVAEQERLLVLLEEKRQAVIANVVTKGLDPTVPMKDSGVEWLGQVPAHWSVATTNMLKAPASTITYGIVQAGPDVEGGIPYVRTSDMSGTELPLTGYLRTTPEIAAAYERSSIKAGDLVIAIRASIGKTLIVPPELAGGNLTQGTAKIEPGRNILAKFLCYVLNSVPCQQHFASIAKGTTFKEITLEMLRKLKVPQPSRAEQQLIVEHLAAVLPSIGQLISEAETARGLLHERRAALISAAVTGKLDVRAVAPATEPALAAE